MRSWLITPTMLLLTSAAMPVAQRAPIDLTPLLQMCGGAPALADDAPTVLLPGFGPGGFPIRTAKPEAQAFFDNGIQLGEAFAHSEAPAAFMQARKIDPSCAMCAWGEAWAKGPTLNYDVSASDSAELAGIVAEARKLAEGGPELERQLIEALGKRYGKNGTDDLAYAQAMEAIAAAHPENDAVVTLAADALMVAARKLHLDDMQPHMARPVALLETVLKRTPDYAPAIHFYIHATEIAGFPERAERFADRLAIIAPAASHLIHMPSHTYYWIGRYRDAAVANVEAIKTNDARAVRLGKREPGAAYAMGNYHWHNAIFGLGGALMSGDGEAGLAIARPMIAAGLATPGSSDYVEASMGHGYVVLARLGPAEAMLAVADPGRKRPTARILWHYARAEAFARLGDAGGLKKELRALSRRASGSAEQFRALAYHVIDGRYAMMRGKPDEAVKAFRAAAAIEESGRFAESKDPPMWWYPVRRSLAAALLQSGDAKGALAEADAALKRRINDPVALAVRAQALAALGRGDEAAKDMAAARRLWLGDPALLAGPLA